MPFQQNHTSTSTETKTAAQKAPEKSFEALVKYCEDIQSVLLLSHYKYDRPYKALSDFSRRNLISRKVVVLEKEKMTVMLDISLTLYIFIDTFKDAVTLPIWRL